jgi:hypothetical protein
MINPVINLVGDQPSSIGRGLGLAEAELLSAV